jgi:RHS repeat-associated protein
MGRSRKSFAEKRRALLAIKAALLDRLEPRVPVTEPISFSALSLGVARGLAEIGIMDAQGRGKSLKVPASIGGSAAGQSSAGSPGAASLRPVSVAFVPIEVSRHQDGASTGGGRARQSAPPAPATNEGPGTTQTAGDWLNLSSASSADSTETGISTPWKPIKHDGGGPVMQGHGSVPAASASSRISRGGAITQAQLAPPAASSGGAGAAGALLAAVAGASAGAGTQAPSPPSAAAAVTGGGAAVSSSRSHAPASPPTSVSPFSGLGAINPSGGGSVLGGSSGAQLPTFAYFPLYVLDNNNGVVLYPGVDQLATLNASVDLLAQVSGTTISSYNWNTSGLGADIKNLSVTNTYQLTWQWQNSFSTTHTDTVTLSVTDVNSHTESYTYDFYLPAGSTSGNQSGGGSNVTWPTSLAPDAELDSSSAFDGDYATVDATSGAPDTSIDLPSYNPNVPAIALTYDSLTADPRPIVLFEHTIDPAQAVSSKVSAQLTFDSSGGTTWYYNSSQLNGGDVEQIALQASPTSLSTGRYSYSATIVDYRTTNTTITVSGSADVINNSASAFGDGWTLQGLEHITTATGGVILDVGDGGRSLWFTGSFGSGGGTYTDPAGEFSTLTKMIGSGGATYSRTLTDGTQIKFNSSGYETAVVDLNGLHTTFSYNGSNQLSSIEDDYGNYTTFTYSSGYLQKITDPAGRVTTFTMSSGSLQSVQQADGSRVTYAYDASGRMTQITDALSHADTISYDSAERVATISLPEGSVQTYTNDQESGWTNSGTSGSPAAPTLLAQAGSTFTTPNGNTSNLQPDWLGLGQTGVVIDALGDVNTFDLNPNGLATVAIDGLNRISQFAYDSQGNTVTIINADLTEEQYTFNSDAEPLTYSDENGNVTSYGYDTHGNLTSVEDALGDLTMMTYTATGQVATSVDSNNHTTSFQYDSQDRLTTVQFPDSTTNLYTYDSQGDVTKFTDGRGNSATMSYDALNRQTGTTDALGAVTSYIYDSGGNLTAVQAPTPGGQTARTTSYSYDSMGRVTTLTDALGSHTVYAYDADGNVTSVKDPLGRITTFVFDALDRQTVVVDPMGGRTTTTYDADSEATQTVDPLGRIATVGYNTRGWVAPVTDPLGHVTTYGYTHRGQTASITLPGASGGSSVSYAYNAADEAVSETDANNNTTSFTYDSGGNTIAVKDANSDTTSYSYDSMNRLTTVTDALGHTTVFGYDGDGNQTTVKDGLGHTTTTLYDALNRPTTITTAVAGTTTIAYDVAGREIGLTDAVGNQTQWAYDGNDRLTTVTLPNAHTVTYVYDADGELTDTTDADGRRTTYAYNSDGDLTGETWLYSSGGAINVITYSYDADNELTRAFDSYATLTFTYDSGGNQLTAATSGPGSGQPSVTLTSTFNAQNERTNLSDNLSSAGSTTFAYDAGQRLTTITTSYGGTAGPQVVYSYDAANRMTSIVRTVAGAGTQVISSFNYDAANRQTTVIHEAFTPSSGGGTLTGLATFVYSYDNASRVTTQVNAEGTYTYTYDNANELTSVRKNGTQVESYSYDLNGNRNSTGYTTTTGSEQTASPGYTYTYDNGGNLISDTKTTTHVVTTYSYDYRNRLTEVITGGTIVATYTYNALNQRIGIDDNGTQTWTVHDGSSPDAHPYADFNGSGTLTQRYLWGGGVVNGAVMDQLLARTSLGGSTAWYLPDKLGSVRDIADNSGNVLDQIVYDSFGNVLSESGPSSGDRLKFAGMEDDSVVGQYYDRARYYECAVGRFLTQDPAGFGAGDPDLYRYVGNDTPDCVDPTGKEPPPKGQQTPITRNDPIVHGVSGLQHIVPAAYEGDFQKIGAIVMNRASNNMLVWENFGNRDNAAYNERTGLVRLNSRRWQMMKTHNPKLSADQVQQMWAMVRAVHEAAHILDEEKEFPTGNGHSVLEEGQVFSLEIIAYQALHNNFGYIDTEMEGRINQQKTNDGKLFWDTLGKDYGRMTKTGLQYPMGKSEYRPFPSGGSHYWSPDPIGGPPP